VRDPCGRHGVFTGSRCWHHAVDIGATRLAAKCHLMQLSDTPHCKRNWAFLTRTTKVDSKPFPWIPESSEAAKTRRFSGFLTDKNVRPTFCRTRHSCRGFSRVSPRLARILHRPPSADSLRSPAQSGHRVFIGFLIVFLFIDRQDA
jgi:hypothetical protein